jgi:TetR/AcrR family transcriptional regulator
MVKILEPSIAGAEEKILQAAKKVFVNRGMDGARMQDIANEAGINKALVHYYFRNKEQLFERIFAETAGRFVPRVKSILLSDLGFYDKISRFCEEYISMAISNPYMPMFVLSEMHRQPEAFLKKMFGNELPDLGRFHQQIQEEITAGKIKPIHPVQLVMNMMSLCIFPFIGKPILGAVMGLDDAAFLETMNERKKQVPQFIFDAIKK